MLLDFDLARLTKRGNQARTWIDPESVCSIRETDRHMRGEWVPVAMISLIDGTKHLVRDVHPDSPEERYVADRIGQALAGIGE